MKVHSFNVIPGLPDNLKALSELSENMWFTWNWEAIMMLVSMDDNLWHRSRRNPKWVLGTLPPERLDQLSRDPEFLRRLENVKGRFDRYMGKTDGWFAKNRDENEKDFLGAYFSMEFGIGEGLPMYSGGLGILSGDHIKSVSDLGIPMVGVGLLYQKGYVQQVLNRDCWQVERFPENDWYNMPVQIVKDSNGQPLRVDVPLASETVKTGVWRVPVGRTSLYLLDTNVTENPPHLRQITDQLYGGDRENRIKQEVVLGIGGVRALAAMGLNPTVYHINEGHSAFLLLERIFQFMRSRGVSFSEAREVVWASSVFTTHTPVIAGNEHFDPELVRKFIEPHSRQFGVSWDDLLKTGKEEDASATFCMTVLAIKLAAFINGVSELHKNVSRAMWKKIWPTLPENEMPIQSITNGIHTCSWVSHEFNELYKKHLLDGQDTMNADIGENCNWDRAENIPDEELWGAHIIRKNKLIGVIRERRKRQMIRLGADHTVVEESNKILNPDILTIGFARRFASYKRANLIFRDPARLAEILNNPKMPVQLVFAGKAHQADTLGKELIKSVACLMSDKRFKDKLVFVEDYNMNVARYMVQGVDVWLNNPVRPMEASGTSGMKAAVNGILNLSVLDGWWPEGYCPEVGWAIGGSEHYRDDAERDYVESEAVYNLIQKVIAPIYYERDSRGIPAGWIRMMKSSIKRLSPRFSTHRMVKEYYARFYVPAHRANKRLMRNDKASEIAAWRRKVEKNWPAVRVTLDTFKPDMEIHSGSNVPVRALAWLGELSPEEVDVQAYIGRIGAQGSFIDGRAVSMVPDGKEGDAWKFRAEISCNRSGRQDFAVRVIPKHEDLVHPFTPIFMKWDE
ncbi:MAG: alpha-glucan family phosphorylase [bacterium]